MGKDIFNTYFGKAYRFIGFDGFKQTIKEETLRFSRIDTFNDPLDCNPLIHPYAYEAYKKAYKKAYVKFKDLNINDFNTYFISRFNDYVDKAYVCCFSKEYKSIFSYLMWAYYGEHRQMCFEIDFKKHNFLGSPSNITYAKDLKSERDLYEAKSADERGLFIATTKSKLWKHEKEVRLIVDIDNENVSNNIKIDDDDKKYLYYHFDIKIISKVIFAVNSDKENEKMIMQLLDSKGHKPIYEKMIINPDTLKLQSISYDSCIT